MLAVILAFFGGLAIVVSKMLNHNAAKRFGLLPGTLLNYLTGTLMAGILAFASMKRFDYTVFLDVPPLMYSAGLLGLGAMLISNLTLNRLPVVHSTSIIVVTQMSVALLLDYWLFGIGSLIRIVGAMLVVIALILDQYIIQYKTANI